MNPHLLQGIIAFTAWATFSTWYYVEHIKVFENSDGLETIEVPSETRNSSNTTDDPVTSADDKVTDPEIHLSQVVLFELNSHQLNASTVLQPIMDTLNALKKDYSVQLQITGHTCDLGSAPYNQSLSRLRAEGVFTQLQPYLSENSSVEVEGLGERQPAMPNSNESNRSKNRRVNITITN